MSLRNQEAINLLQSVIDHLKSDHLQSISNLEKEVMRQKLIRSFDLLFQEEDKPHLAAESKKEVLIESADTEAKTIDEHAGTLHVEEKEEPEADHETPILKIERSVDEAQEGDDESENRASLNDRFNADKTTLVDRINKPQGLLKNAIEMNEKFFFIKELFHGDGNTYEKAIRFIDNLNGLDEAMVYIEKEVAVQQKWENASKARDKFMKAVVLRFSR